MDLDAALHSLAQDPTGPYDLAELALTLARDEYPDLDVEATLSELDAMAREARGYVCGDLGNRVAGLARYLFHEMGFRGNTQEYYDPCNSYLNQVLERRTGIPISLSAVTMAVGQRAGLKVVGVGLPGHFIVKAVQGGQEILFDPFHGGRRLSASDCEHLVRQATGEAFRASPARLRALPLGLIVLRMLSNLKAVYLRNDDNHRAIRVLQRLRQLDPYNPVQQRDLGVCHFQVKQYGKAIDSLLEYLAAAADAEDASIVRELLTRARTRIAEWN
jgi:regulator of sirC expression with transglutaminase-like and TPR domain